MTIKQIGIATSEGFESRVFATADTSVLKVFFVGDLDIDSDGGSNPDHDPYWQPQTSLKFHGKSIDAEAVPGVVVPGWLPHAVGPIVLGCLCKVTNLATGQQAWGVAHDTGPLKKTGETTPAMARRVGVNPNSVSGGEEKPIILYEMWPGKPAVVDGVTYDLQAS